MGRSKSQEIIIDVADKKRRNRSTKKKLLTAGDHTPLPIYMTTGTMKGEVVESQFSIWPYCTVSDDRVTGKVPRQERQVPLLVLSPLDFTLLIVSSGLLGKWNGIFITPSIHFLFIEV